MVGGEDEAVEKVLPLLDRLGRATFHLGPVGAGATMKLINSLLGGGIPFNTDGGLIARGHPGGPTGLAMVHELVTQLRGEAGARQVVGTRRGLAHLVGGGSVCAVNLFEAD